MSTPEQNREEPRSSVKITETAKAEPRVEVKVYAGDTAEAVETAQKIAQDTFLSNVAWLKSKGFRPA